MRFYWKIYKNLKTFLRLWMESSINQSISQYACLQSAIFPTAQIQRDADAP